MNKDGISYVKKDLVQNTRLPLAPSKKIQFAHQATLGDKSINLLSLVTPASLTANGFVQATSQEILAANLAVMSKNLTIISSSKGPLVQYDSWTIIGSTIVFLGALQEFGAEAGETFFGTIDTAPSANSLVVDAKMFNVTIDGQVGDQIINIGNSFKVNDNPTFQLGAIQVYINGQLLMRNVGNATAAPEANGNYQELDSGSGYGTQIKLNTALDTDLPIVVIGGLMMGSADVNVWGAIEKIQGSVLAISKDLAYIAEGTDDVSKYIVASPQEVERRAFGDLLLSLNQKMDAVINQLGVPSSEYRTLSGTIANGTYVYLGSLTVGEAVFSGVDNGYWTFDQANSRYIIQKSGWYVSEIVSKLSTSVSSYMSAQMQGYTTKQDMGNCYGPIIVSKPTYYAAGTYIGFSFYNYHTAAMTLNGGASRIAIARVPMGIEL